MPLNGTIANIVLRDLDVNLQGQTFQVAIMRSKGLKCKHYYCHQIGSRVFAIELYIMTLIYISRSRILKWEYLKTMIAIEKCSNMNFIEVNICHGRGHCKCRIPRPWPSFSYYAFAIKKCAGSRYPRQICLDSHGPRRGVAPVHLIPCNEIFQFCC